MARTRARGRARNRSNRTHPHDGWLIFTRPSQHWIFRLLGLIVRFRAELTLTTITVTVYSYARTHWGPVTLSLTGFDPVTVDFSDPTIIAIVAGFVLLIVAAIPATRRYVHRRIWCVITRHRVRACLVQTLTMARANGRLPFLMWARPSPVGEHLTVWLPAGLSVNDLDRVSPQLAAACYARDCRITAWEWKVMLVDLHIVRRDPLGTRTVASDLTDTDLDNDLDPADRYDTSPADLTDTPDGDQQVHNSHDREMSAAPRPDARPPPDNPGPFRSPGALIVPPVPRASRSSSSPLRGCGRSTWTHSSPAAAHNTPTNRAGRRTDCPLAPAPVFIERLRLRLRR